MLRLVPTAEGFAVSCMPGLRPHSCQFVSCRDAIFAGPFVLGSHVWFSFADFESPDRGGLGPLHMSALLWMSFALAWVYTTWPVGGSFSRCSFARRHARDVHRTPALFWIACTSACRSLWLLNHSFGWQVVCLHSFIEPLPPSGGARRFHRRAGINLIINTSRPDYSIGSGAHGAFLAEFFGHTSWGSIPLETWCGLGFDSPGDMVRLGVRFPFSMVRLGVQFPWRHGAARGSIPLETWCGLEA